MKKISMLFLLLVILTVGMTWAEETKKEMPSQQVPAVAALPAQTNQVPPKVDSGDTTWMLISSALVMLMTPGLALFYGGPASGFVGPISAIFIGLAAGTVCYLAINLKSKFKYDDSLDVVGVHGVGGTLGALATELFASKAINPAGSNGLFFGNPALLGNQAVSVAVAWIYSFVVTWIILKLLDRTLGLRVSEEHEVNGLDLSQHGETGYSF